MRIMFVGESPGRVVLVGGTQVHAEHSVPVDLPEDVARSLLEQDVWVVAPKATKTKEQG